MSAFLNILTIVSLLLVTPAACPHARADTLSTLSPHADVMAEGRGHQNHDMMVHAANDLHSPDTPHADHGCGDGCDGGLDCSSCMMMSALPALSGQAGATDHLTLIRVFTDEHGLGLTGHPEPPPPRA